MRSCTGEIVRWFGASVDIHDRKLMEDALRESEERPRELNATLKERNHLSPLTKDMLAQADHHGRISAVNPAWMKVLGWSEQELLTNPHADIIHPEDVGVTIAALLSMGETKQQRHPSPPVVLTSGYSHVLAKERRRGFEPLHKLYAVEGVSRVLRRVTQGRDTRWPGPLCRAGTALAVDSRSRNNSDAWRAQASRRP